MTGAVVHSYANFCFSCMVPFYTTVWSGIKWLRQFLIRKFVFFHTTISGLSLTKNINIVYKWSLSSMTSILEKMHLTLISYYFCNRKWIFEGKTYLIIMMMMMPLEFSCLPIITSEYLSRYLALIGWLGVTISILCAAKIHI